MRSALTMVLDISITFNFTENFSSLPLYLIVFLSEIDLE